MNILKALLTGLRQWWSEFTLQAKLLALSTLVVSIIMTGLTFFSFSSIQSDARLSDTRYARDVGLLLAANVTSLVAEGEDRQLITVANRFWQQSSSIRYILFADPDGVIYLTLPLDNADEDSTLLLRRRLELPDSIYDHPEEPLVRQHLSPDGQVTDVFVPLMANGQNLGSVALGLNPNEVVLNTMALTRKVTIAVFIAIWVLVILGAVFNALTITHPIKALLHGVRKITAGQFATRIALPMGGELGELLEGFNAMASQLEVYKAANIEEMKAANKELKVAQAQQQSLIATMADGAMLLDDQGCVVLANPTSQRLFRWEARKLVGEPLVNLLPESLLMDVGEALQQVLAGEHATRDIRCSFGSPTRTLRIVLVAVTDPSSSSLKGVTVTLQDLSREVELNAAQSRFISNVSHELRTPLFNIKTYVETLHDLWPQISDEERREFLATANAETDRLTRLVNDVLDLSRLESGQEFRFEPMELRPALEQTLRNYRLNASDKGVRLLCEVEPTLPRVQANFDLLLQVLDNLVGNALKFTPSGGLVCLRAYLWPDSCPVPEVSSSATIDDLTSRMPRLRVEVSDTGCGMNELDQAQIFGRFYRAENTVHTEQGTGLGLAIVHNIMEKQGSVPKLVSKPGVGTTFWFQLPLEGSDDDELALLAERSQTDTTNDTTISRRRSG
ncbi:MAG: histidine kinase [Candidatus Synechococcus spongiarum 142]|uniref:histidine kinase n=1 Tax=Candidatus Synechococcus spongiarum 142 TaxID=1608213 RepID=A0A6N3XB30_9SYNE|nr:MAG: histidine kinase [Candidatus Synechococcus spongiarum 142]